MKKLVFLFCFVVLGVNCFAEENWLENPTHDLDTFMRRYPAYQDIFVNGKVVQRGTSFCSTRYELIRPILELYNRKFSVLDIGAMEGYFSFRIAEDYNAVCTMIEGGSDPEQSKLYWYAQEKLYNLCHLNNHLDNVELLAHRLTVPSLNEFKNSEHFDVVLAFLVIHLMAADEKGHVSLEKIQNYLDTMLELGNDVIIEMSVDVYHHLDKYVHDFCKKKGGIYLGELPRTIALDGNTRGRFYWFRKSSNRDGPDATNISLETFKRFNGIYPER